MRELFWTEKGIHYHQNEFKPGRTTLVFIHGLSGSASAWLEYEKHFEGQFNVLTYDLRGHGESKRYAKMSDYALSNFVTDLEELLRYCGIEKAVLVGHSLGAAIAIDLAVKCPRLVEKLVLLSPDFDTRQIRFWKHLFPFLGWIISAVGITPVFRHHGRHIDYSRYPDGWWTNIGRMAADINNTGLHVCLYCLKYMYQYDCEPSLPQIVQPVLIIHGRLDTVVPVENSVNIAGKIGNCRLVVLEKGNHIIVLNNPTEIENEIERFV